MKRFSRILWGVVLVALGVIYGLKALGIADINLFFNGWWTLFIIVPSVISLFTERDKTASAICLLAGVLLLLASWNVITYEILWKLIVPIAIVIIGLLLIFHRSFDRSSRLAVHNAENVNGEVPSYTATFSGEEINFNNQIFNGATLTAVFGGVDLDLTNATVQQDVVIDAAAIFGGIDIKLPSYVNVKTSSTSVFGGISDKKHQNSPNNTVTVFVRGTSIFGGVDIK